MSTLEEASVFSVGRVDFLRSSFPWVADPHCSSKLLELHAKARQHLTAGSETSPHPCRTTKRSMQLGHAPFAALSTRPIGRLEWECANPGHDCNSISSLVARFFLDADFAFPALDTKEVSAPQTQNFEAYSAFAVSADDQMHKRNKAINRQINSDDVQ